MDPEIQMTEIKPGETQQEFFGEFSKTPQQRRPIPPDHRLQRPILLTTSAEQVILVGILLILAACFIFFLGLMRGKAISAKAERPSVFLQNLTSVPAPVVSSVAPVSTAVKPTVNTRMPPQEKAGISIVVQDPNRPYTIQLVTYKNQNLAEKEAAILRRSGYFAVIVPNGEY